jgi:hypothetical protein
MLPFSKTSWIQRVFLQKRKERKGEGTTGTDVQGKATGQMRTEEERERRGREEQMCKERRQDK